MSGLEAAPPWKENSARGIFRDAPWTALWQSRELITYLALRDIKLRYRQAALGVLWVLAQPLASVAIFTVVFSRFVGIDTHDVPYPLFALVGMVTWIYFSSSVVAASDVLVSNANLVTKVYFPRIAAPTASLISPAVDLAIGLIIVGALGGYYGTFSGLRLAMVPLWLLLLVTFTWGLALWLSALNVRYRDVQHAVAPVLQIWLLASPVAYPASVLRGWQEIVYALNPMVGIVELGRWSILGTPWPGWPLLVSSGAAGLVLLSGLTYFYRAQRTFADVI